MNTVKELVPLKVIFVFSLVLQLTACASTSAPTKASASSEPSIVVGQTTKQQVQRLLGNADEHHTDDDGSEIWIYIYRVNVPILVSLIPIVGDLADTVDMIHKDHEIIVQFQNNGVVKKYKVRALK